MKKTVLAVVVAAAGIAQADTEATQALNELRAQNGRDAVSYSIVLEQAARGHARDMARNGIFSHTGSDGSDVAQRVSETGYGWCVVAENIAKGQRDLDEVMQAWADSPGHRQNMLSPDVTEFALVDETGFIWVMVLAAPGC